MIYKDSYIEPNNFCVKSTYLKQHVVKPRAAEQSNGETRNEGTGKPGTLNPDHKIWNGNSRKINSWRPTDENVLLDGLAKPGIAKHRTQNLEK